MSKNENKIESAFEALTKLSEIGKKSKVEQIGNLKLLLTTLTSDEETNVFIACSELTGNAYFNKLKSETLKYAIKAVNDQRLDEYESIKEEVKREVLRKETLLKLEKILGSWDENVIAFLYTKWVAISKESEKELQEKGFLDN